MKLKALAIFRSSTLMMLGFICYGIIQEKYKAPAAFGLLFAAVASIACWVTTLLSEDDEP